MNNLYYKAPEDKVFKEVKEKAIEIWNTYDDKYGYATEKIGRIKDIQNIKDNVMYMVAMFDLNNRQKLMVKLSPETKKEIADRILEGNNL